MTFGPAWHTWHSGMFVEGSYVAVVAMAPSKGWPPNTRIGGGLKSAAAGLAPEVRTSPLPSKRFFCLGGKGGIPNYNQTPPEVPTGNGDHRMDTFECNRCMSHSLKVVCLCECHDAQRLGRTVPMREAPQWATDGGNGSVV